MEGEEIALCKQCVLIQPGIFRAIAFSRDGMEDHPAAEGLRGLRHPSADVAHACDAPGLALQLAEGQVEIGEPRLGAVGPGFHVMVIMEQLLAQGKRQGEGVLGHHGRAVVPHIRHLDAPSAAVVQVAVVEARGEFADQLHVRRVRQCLPVQGGFVGDDDVRVLHPLPDLLQSDSVVINGDLAKLAHAVHGHVRAHAVPLQYHDFHLIRISFL